MNAPDSAFLEFGKGQDDTTNEFVQQDQYDQSITGSVDINRFIPSSWGIWIPLQFNWAQHETVLLADCAERVRDDELGTIKDDSLRWSTNFYLVFGQMVDREVSTKSPSIAPSMDFKWLVNDPGTSKTLWYDNRLEINGGISGAFDERTRNGETRADNWRMSGSFGGDYNISQSIKSSFSGNYSIFNDNFQNANARQTWGLNASVDFRF